MTDIRAPDGTIIRFPAGTSDETIRTVMRREYGGPTEATAGETALDATTRFMGGINRAVANTLMLPFRASAWLTGTQGRGFEGVGEQVLDPWLNQPEARTRAGRYAEAAGEGIGSTLGPSAALFGAAGRLPATASAIPSLREALLRPIASNPGAAAAIDLAAGTGAGLATEVTREAGGGPTEQTLAALAGGMGLPMAGSVAGRNIMRGVESGTRRLGIHSSADGGLTASTPEGRRRALQMMADQLLRDGMNVDEINSLLAQMQRSRTVHSSGRGQDVLTLADLVPGWQRLAGSAARQFPEAARDVSRFITARQTGISPEEGAGPLAQRGLPTRELMAPPITGAEARRAFGSTFGAALRGLVPMGQRGRMSDFLRRSLVIRDAEHHGHLPSAYQTRLKLEREGKAESDRLYGRLRMLGEGHDPGPAIQPIINRVRAVIDNPATGRTEAELLQKGLNEFYRNGRLVSSVDGFDQAQRALRALYESADSNTRRVLGGLRRELVDAVDIIKDKGIGDAYRAARRSHFDAKRMDEAYELGRKGPGEVDDFVGRYGALRNEAERKVARLGLWKHYDDRMARLKPTDNALNIFKQKDMETLQAVIPRTTTPKTGRPKGEFGDRPERFGRYAGFEGRMIEARDRLRSSHSGYSTARDLNDDLAFASLEAMQNVQSLTQLFRGSSSMWDFGQKMLERIIDRSFGISADSAKALARMLFTADPVERARILREVAAIMPPDRMTRFNQMMERALATRAAAPSAAAAAGTALQPEQRP